MSRAPCGMSRCSPLTLSIDIRRHLGDGPARQIGIEFGDQRRRNDRAGDQLVARARRREPCIEPGVVAVVRLPNAARAGRRAEHDRRGARAPPGGRARGIGSRRCAQRLLRWRVGPGRVLRAAQARFARAGGVVAPQHVARRRRVRRWANRSPRIGLTALRMDSGGPPAAAALVLGARRASGRSLRPKKSASATTPPAMIAPASSTLRESRRGLGGRARMERSGAGGAASVLGGGAHGAPGRCGRR